MHPHKLHNAIVRESKEDKLVGHMHAIVSSWSIAARRQKLVDAFSGLVSEELEVFPGPAPQEYRQHTESVVERTLLRRIRLVRARAWDSEAKRGKALLRATQCFMSVVNGADPDPNYCTRSVLYAPGHSS